jgi:hypothetical protein
MEVCTEVMIEVYAYAIPQIKQRFKIQNVHVAAALCDPSQKNATFLEKYLPEGTSRKELLKDMLIKYNIPLEPIAVDVVESPGPAKKTVSTK